MPDTEPIPPQRSESQPSRMFVDPTPERSFPTTAVAIAATAVAILVAFLALMAHRGKAAPAPNTVLPSAAYAPHLIFSDVHLSDATTGSGGRLLYVEGHVANHGPSTLTGITIQLIFANALKMAPQIETVPLNMIYMREPYVDTRPVGASPLAPKAEGDFRLIFDDINENWDQQPPQIHAIQIVTR
jgi:hypothetical protein